MDDATRLLPRKTGTFPALPRKVPILPRVPFIPVVTQPSYVPPPPPVTAPFEEPITSSLRAPEDVVLQAPRGELRTTFSNEAALIADLLRSRFAKRRYGPARYRLRVEEPGGPSTAGGLLARQALSLVSRGDSVPAIICGWVDVARREAQLRSHGVVVRRHLRHHGSAPDLSAKEYERFLHKLMDTLFEGGIRLVLHVPDEQDSLAAPSPFSPRRGSPGSVLGVLSLAVLTFLLGLSVGHLTSWLEQIPSCLENATALLR